MLCENLMVMLVEEGILLKAQCMGAIETVIEVKHEIAGTSESVVVSMASIGLLRAVSQSVSAASRSTGPDARAQRRSLPRGAPGRPRR